ncbi:MAG: hypothetical protein JWO38_7346 [Gemmataceae bacterium]|nr:hypothetical protein [Gemmataceae bacterium]
MYNQLMKVSKGFRLVYIGMLLMILGVVGGIIGMCVAGGALAAVANQGGGRGVGGAVGLVAVIAGGMLLLILAGSITGLIGRFFCLAVPERAGAAKPIIVISVVMELVALGLGILNSASDFAGLVIPPGAKLGLQGGNVILSLASAVLFLLFTKTVARFVRRRDLADKAMSVLWLWVSTIGCYAVGVVIVVVMGVAAGGVGQGGGAMGGACVGLVLMLAALIIALVALVRYITLLKEMSEATARYARRARHEPEEDDEDEDEDEDDEDDRPRGRGRRSSRDDEDEDDDRPRGRGRRTSRYDDEDEDDDRPRRRTRRDW